MRSRARSSTLQNVDYQAIQQEQWLRQEALQCLASASQALLAWYKEASRQGTDGARCARARSRVADAMALTVAPSLSPGARPYKGLACHRAWTSGPCDGGRTDGTRSP